MRILRLIFRRQNAAYFIVFSAILSVCNPLHADSGGGFIFDHSPYAAVLKANVQNEKVDYQNLKQRRENLDDYIVSLENLSEENYKKMNKHEKVAFWANAYNAITLQVIIDHYPITRHGFKGLLFPSSSIRQIPGAWDEITRRILEKETTLNEIEHEILRKQFRDPRVHFALVCASIGCPELRNEPYEGGKLDLQLQDQIHRFFSNPEKARYDIEKQTLYLSPIFKWFAKDFDAVGGVLSFIKAHVQVEGFRNLSANTKIEWLDYDWSLNEKK